MSEKKTAQGIEVRKVPFEFRLFASPLPFSRE